MSQEQLFISYKWVIFYYSLMFMLSKTQGEAGGRNYPERSHSPVPLRETLRNETALPVVGRASFLGG
jgi:hypothetical protein